MNDWPETRNCVGACVITDAERYTSIAERIDPASTVEFVNRYLEVLFRPVFDNGGVVADVKGDGMLAVWVESPALPDLQARVCRACLQIAEASAKFFDALPGFGLATRIGACHGPIALATVGAFAHHEYRAVGDTVNTASRLEELNKVLGTRILVSASLARGAEGFEFRDLGEVELRGKRNAVHVLELKRHRYLSGCLTRSPASNSTSSKPPPEGSDETQTTAKLAQAAFSFAS